MKYKKLTKEQIIISIDRLTRFKYSKEKYIRVFSDIVLSCLIEPKLRKSELESMDLSELTSIAEEIFNESIYSLIPSSKSSNVRSESNYINSLLKQYENNVYINDEETQKLLNNNILYIHAIDLISEKCPVNVKWLKTVCTKPTNDLRELRFEHSLKYPLEKIILAEGITEEILLPAFSRYLGHDFYKNGVQIIAAGGKNQVVKSYYKLIEEVKLPIYILLDKDAEENIRQIKPKLRDIDKIHLVSCGEFEDLLPKSLIIKTVNKRYGNFFTISDADLSQDCPTAKVLEELFRTKGLYEFKKADFAKLVRDNISEKSDISDEIRWIIKELSN